MVTCGMGFIEWSGVGSQETKVRELQLRLLTFNS